jgi:hypothetical protein
MQQVFQPPINKSQFIKNARIAEVDGFADTLGRVSRLRPTTLRQPWGPTLFSRDSLSSLFGSQQTPPLRIQQN